MSSNNKYRPSNKRKPPWQAKKRGAKRFNYDREENASREWGNYEYDVPYNSGHNHRMGHYTHWQARRDYDRRSNLPSLCEYPHPYPNLPSQEQVQETAETSILENERKEKILATKKRIEEALASTNSGSQEINLKDSQDINEVNKNKYSETNACIKEGVGLRLTNSDFKEIGSVESGVAADLDTSDMVLNVQPVVAQKRSFDTTGLSAQIIPPVSKPRVEGWTMTSTNEITHQRQQESPNTSSSGLISHRGPRNLHLLNTSDSGALSSVVRRAAGEIFRQESREEILGQIDPAIRQENADRPPPKPSQPRRDFTNVGNLYQSFLRTRLYGYTLRQRNKTTKPSGPNPLLDRSVLENQNSEEISRQQNTILEIQMPRPILVKAELEDAVNTDNIEEEANEFCKEYSYLLTDPNLLIPSENLEKLGLGHLSEMNDLVSKRSDKVLTSSSNGQEKIFRVRSLNGDSEKDLVVEQPASNLNSNIDSANSQPFTFNFQPTEAKESVHNSPASSSLKTIRPIDSITPISGQGVSGKY